MCSVNNKKNLVFWYLVIDRTASNLLKSRFVQQNWTSIHPHQNAEAISNLHCLHGIFVQSIGSGFWILMVWRMAISQRERGHLSRKKSESLTEFASSTSNNWDTAFIFVKLYADFSNSKNPYVCLIVSGLYRFALFFKKLTVMLRRIAQYCTDFHILAYCYCC